MQLSPEEPLTISPLPTELLKLRKFIILCSNDITKFQEDRYQEILKLVMKYMNKRYIEIFDKRKEYSDKHLAEEIFQYDIARILTDSYIRCSWQAIEKCFLDLSSRITIISNDIKVNPDILKSEIDYLEDIVSSVLIFLNEVETQKDIKHNGYGYERRNIANSSEAFQASRDHLHHLTHNTFSSFFRPSISVFLIRQSIELRMKNALGIVYICTTNGEALKITPDNFIEFIYTKSNIKCEGIDKSLVKKIHKWSNDFIHGGFLMPSWQVWFAQYILRPLFSDGQKIIGGTEYWSFHGSIQIEKYYYHNSLDDDMKLYICEKYNESRKSNLTPDKLYIEKMSPEALLI